MIALSLVDGKLVHYIRSVRSVEFAGDLRISGEYALFPDETRTDQSCFNWPDDYPGAGKPGVYLIFSAQRTLLYVGSSTRDVQARLGCYFGYESGLGSRCKIRDMKPPWKSDPCYIRTITVADPEEAPRLERFFISTLKPPDNTRSW